jgi:cytochrome c nitrite reductase small subunit
LLWAVTLGIGLLIGIGVFTFVYARGGSYLTDKPEACVNCHVMREQYAGWVKGSHRLVAVCNDCHTPDGLEASRRPSVRRSFWNLLS